MLLTAYDIDLLNNFALELLCLTSAPSATYGHINLLALELDIHSLAHHLCKMSIFYEPRRIRLGYTRHFLQE